MSLNQIQQSVERLNGVRGVSVDYNGSPVVEVRTDDMESLKEWAAETGHTVETSPFDDKLAEVR